MTSEDCDFSMLLCGTSSSYCYECPSVPK